MMRVGQMNFNSANQQRSTEAFKKNTVNCRLSITFLQLVGRLAGDGAKFYPLRRG